MSVEVDGKKYFTQEMTRVYETWVIECPDCGFSFSVAHFEDGHEGVYSCPACAEEDLMIELERQRDGLKGAAVIANHAGGRIRELEQENKRYREALEKIRDMHRFKNNVQDAIDVAKKALEGEQ